MHCTYITNEHVNMGWRVCLTRCLNNQLSDCFFSNYVVYKKGICSRQISFLSSPNTSHFTNNQYLSHWPFLLTLLTIIIIICKPSTIDQSWFPRFLKWWAAWWVLFVDHLLHQALVMSTSTTPHLTAQRTLKTSTWPSQLVPPLHQSKRPSPPHNMLVQPSEPSLKLELRRSRSIENTRDRQWIIRRLVGILMRYDIYQNVIGSVFIDTKCIGLRNLSSNVIPRMPGLIGIQNLALNQLGEWHHLLLQ